MINYLKMAGVAAAVALAACSTMNTPAAPAASTPTMRTSDTSMTGAVPASNAMPMRWTATLNPQNGSGVSGNATVNDSSVMVAIRGATSGDVHPWHVHVGQCGGNGPIYGPASAYPPLTVGSDGSASATAVLPNRPASGVQYYVNVHKSATEMGNIVACGDLVAAAGM